MDTFHDDRFLVLWRLEHCRDGVPEGAGEEPLATCASYEEARNFRRALPGAVAGKCVIRFVGTSGGGD